MVSRRIENLWNCVLTSAIPGAIIYFSYYWYSSSPTISTPFFPGVFTKNYSSPISELISMTSMDFVKTNNAIDIIGHSTFKQCIAKQYSWDSVHYKTEDCYNCLGWAVWEKKWLEVPGKRYDDIKQIKNSIEDFLYLHQKTFKDFSLDEGVFPAFKEVSCSQTSSNMIAFYFQALLTENGRLYQWTHAARYLENPRIENEQREANKWTSKLGLKHLVSHNDLEDVSELYGNIYVCFAPDFENQIT